MTEVLFYHLQNMSLESVLPPLLEKSLERGWRVVVQSTSPERTEALDAHLWTYSDDSFLPHATWRAGDAQDQPIILSIEEGNPNRANVRFLIDNAALPADCDSYERLVLVFNGEDDDALAAARGIWTDCKTRGFEVTYWQADERGRWQRRGKGYAANNDKLQVFPPGLHIVTVAPEKDGGGKRLGRGGGLINPWGRTTPSKKVAWNVFCF